MNVFWRDTPLTEKEIELWNLVRQAHFASTHRNNCSSQAVLNAYQGSGDYVKAIISALSTLGVKHAPVPEVMSILSQPIPMMVITDIEYYSKHTDKFWVPGWGNSFIRGERDALWLDVDNFIKENWPEIYGKIEDITKALHDNGKDVYPNPACYTAATCIILGVPVKIAPFLFVDARIAGWSNLILKHK